MGNPTRCLAVFRKAANAADKAAVEKRIRALTKTGLKQREAAAQAADEQIAAVQALMMKAVARPKATDEGRSSEGVTAAAAVEANPEQPISNRTDAGKTVPAAPRESPSAAPTEPAAKEPETVAPEPAAEPSVEAVAPVAEAKPEAAPAPAETRSAAPGDQAKTLSTMLDEAGTQGVWLATMTQKGDESVDVKVIRWPTRNAADWGFEWYANGKRDGGLPFPSLKSTMTAQQMADLLLDYLRVDNPGRFAMTQIGEKHAKLMAQRSTLDQRKADAEMASMRKWRGDTEAQPWDETDLTNKREHDRISAARYKTAAQEKMLALLEARIKANPAKWAAGDGVGYRVGSNQINRGFQVVAINAADKTATIRQVADTGLTSTGGNDDRIGAQAIDIADLVRDRKYDAQKAAPGAAEEGLTAPTPESLQSAEDRAAAATKAEAEPEAAAAPAAPVESIEAEPAAPPAAAPAKATRAPVDVITMPEATIAGLAGKQVSIEVAVGDSGKTATLTMDAAAAVRDVRKRLDAAQQLARCL